LGRAHDLRREADSRVLVELQLRCNTGLDLWRELLWHLDIHAQSVRVGNTEQLRAGTLSGIDQGANVRIARRHYAVERRYDTFERLQLLEPADIRLRRICGGLGGLRGRRACV